jgi:hypothetical protein
MRGDQKYITTGTHDCDEGLFYGANEMPAEGGSPRA